MNKINNKAMNFKVIEYSAMDYPRQSGMTLIVSLVILMALTILGVTSMQSTRTEISMAGNLRESGIAFNAAEAGLRAAEDFVNNSTTITIFNDPSIGLYPELVPDPPLRSERDLGCIADRQHNPAVRDRTAQIHRSLPG